MKRGITGWFRSTCFVAAVFFCVLTFRGWAVASVHVAVSIPPQAFFVKQVGGKRVSVHVLLPPGANPATYEPKPKALVDLRKAVLYFRIHVPFEDAWMEKFRAVNGRMRVVDTVAGMKERIKGDPHVWLAPSLVKYQARVMAEALSEVDPQRADIYKQNTRRFEQRLDALSREIRACFEGITRSTFLVYHPCWGYFAKEFGLRQVAIEREGKAPGASYLATVIRAAKERGIRCVFAQPQFDTRNARAIARALGARVVLLDPLARAWDTNLKEVAERIAQCLKR